MLFESILICLSIALFITILLLTWINNQLVTINKKQKEKIKELEDELKNHTPSF